MRTRPGRALALLAAILLFSCQTAAPPTATPGGSPSATGPAASGAPTGDVEPTAAPADLPPTSEELIQAGLEAGTITFEQSLVYRALALYDSPGLPQDFRSPVMDMHAAGDLMGEIDSHQAELSAATLEQLAPYRVRPADPTSIFNNPPPRAGSEVTLALAASPTWRSAPAAGGAARVWVKDSPEYQTQLTQHAADVTKVWMAFPPFFTYPNPDKPNDPYASVNPDSATDFYFINVGDLDPRRPWCIVEPASKGCALSSAHHGFAQRADVRGRTSSSGYLVIDAARTGAGLLDTLAHELAHASQFAYDFNETSWLYESTATWVAYRVMKSFGESPDYAYAWLQQDFADLDLTLTRDEDSAKYGSWLYFLFASMEEGDAVVGAVWEAAAAEGQQGERAVDNVFAFEEHFADYAVRDWNREPVERLYKTYDSTFPPNHQPDVRNSEPKLGAGDEDELDARLPALASAYYTYVPELDARTITFDNRLVGVPGAHVWAIRNIKDTWQRPEDWTEVANKEFCRDIEAEDLWQLVIVVSNADLKADLKPAEPPRIAATAKGCGGWRGTMSATMTWNRREGHGTATSNFDGLWVEDPEYSAPRCYDPDPAECATWYRAEGTIKWTWDSHHSDPDRPCDETTGGSVPTGLELHNDQQRLALEPVAEGRLKYWGIGNFTAPDHVCSGYVGEGNRYGPGFFGLSEQASSSVGAGGGNTCGTTDWQIDENATSISGSCFEFEYDYNSLYYEWNLQRVGPAPGG